VKITQEKAIGLLKQIREKAVALGYDGKASDAEAIDTFLKEAGIEIESDGKTVKAKALMEVVGTLDLTPVEESVETDEYDEDEKMADEDEEEKGKSLRAKMARTASKSPRRDRDMFASDLYAAKAAQGRSHFANKDAAEIFGAWARKASIEMMNRRDSGRVQAVYESEGQARKDAEILRAHFGTKTAGTVDPTLGASLIAEAFDTDLILIKNEFGNARRLADVVTGFEQVHNYTVDGDDVEAFWIGESQPGIEDENKMLPQRVVANKLLALGRASMEIYLKPAVAIADKFAVSMLRSIYRKEDLAWISGDGSGNYGGTVGLGKRLLDLDGTPANISGVQIAATWAGVDYDALVGVISRVSKGNTANFKFLTSHRFYWTVMRPEIIGQGGTDAAQISAGGPPKFEGFDIVIDHSGAIPNSSTDATFAAFFGDFSLSSKMLEVSNSMRFDVSEDVHFETDEVGLKYREQVGFNTHGQGTAADSGSYGGLYIKS
jgi:HK97 family phage major capsid protein